MVIIWSKFTVLCQSSYFVVYFKKIKINLVLLASHLLLFQNIRNFASVNIFPEPLPVMGRMWNNVSFLEE